MFADMDEDRLEDEVGEEARAEGPMRMFAGDLREKLTIANLLSATVDAFDRVDILVNASRQMACRTRWTPRTTRSRSLLAQNLLTSLRMSQMTAKRMIQHGRARRGRAGTMLGAIINLSSIAAQATQPELLGYSIGCGGAGPDDAVAGVALAPKGIRVNAVAFGIGDERLPAGRVEGTPRLPRP